MKRVTGICLITKNVSKLSAFYRTLLGLERSEDDYFTALPTNGSKLSIFDAKGMEDMAPSSMSGAGCGSYTIEIEVDDVDREHDRAIRLGIPVVKEPTTQPWGRRSVWLRDPDGNIVNLYTNVEVMDLSHDLSQRVREFFHRLLNMRDLSVCDEMLSDGYIDHDAPTTAPSGPDSIKEFAAAFLREYPDMRVEIEDVFAEGNRVAARVEWFGHHRQTGEVFHRRGNIIFRADDKFMLAERWSAYSTPE